ncbi:MAG: hypothetical protein ACI9C1_002392 [Candidatus Aldehydirespiratoraceae bacterium]|jgi:hypothetical protein
MRNSWSRSIGAGRVIAAVAAFALLAVATPVAAQYAGPPGSSGVQNVEGFAPGRILPVFAEGTDPAYAAETLERMRGTGPSAAQPTTRWNPAATALNNGGAAPGDALELTWSILPDGTAMPAQDPGDTTCNSNLIATMDAVYGVGSWQAEILEVWADWTAKTGNVYTPAVTPDASGTPIDDGEAWPSAGGLTNVRGDIRIGGCEIDGDNNALAYNFFPSAGGDMKIDASDSWYTVNGLSPEFHNVFSHEHGHGAGLGHVCPIDGSKLMEPTIQSGFLGLQHDDLRGLQRHYGDRFELIGNPNDSQVAATDILSAGSGLEADLSIDNNVDEDWFRFDATAGDVVDVSVTPEGYTYPEGADPASDLCVSATPTMVSSQSLQDLSFEIRNNAGVLQTVDDSGLGGTESATAFALGSTATYFIRVLGGGAVTQLYNLEIDLNPADNDSFTTPAIVTHLPYTEFDDTTGFTIELNEPAPSCAAFPRAHTAWWEWTAPGTGPIQVDTDDTPIVDTLLAVFTGNSLGSLSEVACDDDSGPGVSSRVNFSAVEGTVYRIQVDAFDDEEGPIQLNVSRTADWVPGTPETPATTPGNGEVTVSWSAPDDGGAPVSTYAVTGSPGGSCITAATSCLISGLANAVPHTFRVSATNAVGISPLSPASDPVLPVAPPGAPGTPTVVPGDGSLSVTWTVPATNGGAPILTYTATGSPAGMCTATAPATTCDMTGLDGATAHTVTVVAANVSGDGPASPASVATFPSAIPGAPTGVLVDRDGTSATVSWTTPGASGDAASLTHTVTGSPGGMCTAVAPATSCVVSGLDNWQAYSFTVTATNSQGTSPPSEPSVEVASASIIDCAQGLPMPFVDVSTGSFAYGAVTCISALGVTTGTSATTYSPANNVTREQMAAFVARLYRSITALPCSGGTTTFTDVSPLSFAATDISCIATLGVTTGTSATTYSPADNVTREQMAAFIARLYRIVTGNDCSGATPFTDVSLTSFARDDIGCIFGLGVTTGTSATTYSPADNVTREQMAAFLARLFTEITT